MESEDVRVIRYIPGQPPHIIRMGRDLIAQESAVGGETMRVPYRKKYEVIA